MIYIENILINLFLCVNICLGGKGMSVESNLGNNIKLEDIMNKRMSEVFANETPTQRYKRYDYLRCAAEDAAKEALVYANALSIFEYFINNVYEEFVITMIENASWLSCARYYNYIENPEHRNSIDRGIIGYDRVNDNEFEKLKKDDKTKKFIFSDESSGIQAVFVISLSEIAPFLDVYFRRSVDVAVVTRFFNMIGAFIYEHDLYSSYVLSRFYNEIGDSDNRVGARHFIDAPWDKVMASCYDAKDYLARLKAEDEFEPMIKYEGKKRAIALLKDMMDKVPKE